MSEEWNAWVGLSVSAHVRSDTAIDWKVYGGDGRVVLSVQGKNFVYLDLFLDRADLVRLRDSASAALDDLGSAMTPAGADAA